MNAQPSQGVVRPAQSSDDHHHLGAKTGQTIIHGNMKQQIYKETNT